MRTSAFEEAPLVRKMCALDKPPFPLTVDVFYGRPLRPYFHCSYWLMHMQMIGMNFIYSVAKTRRTATLFSLIPNF